MKQYRVEIFDVLQKTPNTTIVSTLPMEVVGHRNFLTCSIITGISVSIENKAINFASPSIT